jgi:hypothetical protein
MSTSLLLPPAEDAGQIRRWYLPLTVGEDEVEGGLDYYRTFARFLGMGTSHAPEHQPHPDRFVKRGERCNACRWFEVRIFREVRPPDDADLPADWSVRPDVLRRATAGDYVLHTTGMSVVDGEVPLYKHEVTASSFSVVEYLTTRRVGTQGPEAFLARPSARALAEAAEYDVGLRDAYINRAVS